MGQWLGVHTFTSTAQVQSLVWQLRSHIKLFHIVTKKKKKKKEEEDHIARYLNIFFNLLKYGRFTIVSDIQRRVQLFLLFFGGGLHVQPMEVPRLGVQSELPLQPCATATVTQDLSRVCNLHHSSQQLWTLNPLSGARD